VAEAAAGVVVLAEVAEEVEVEVEVAVAEGAVVAVVAEEAVVAPVRLPWSLQSPRCCSCPSPRRPSRSRRS
jgi:hypothetical protein